MLRSCLHWKEFYNSTSFRKSGQIQTCFFILGHCNLSYVKVSCKNTKCILPEHTHTHRTPPPPFLAFLVDLLLTCTLLLTLEWREAISYDSVWGEARSMNSKYFCFPGDKRNSWGFKLFFKNLEYYNIFSFSSNSENYQESMQKLWLNNALYESAHRNYGRYPRAGFIVPQHE